jgi:hypothetical protein
MAAGQRRERARMEATGESVEEVGQGRRAEVIEDEPRREGRIGASGYTTLWEQTASSKRPKALASEAKDEREGASKRPKALASEAKPERVRAAANDPIAQIRGRVRRWCWTRNTSGWRARARRRGLRNRRKALQGPR